MLIGPTKTNWRAHFEFGTSQMSARPFIEPAFHARKGEALQILADDFERAERVITDIKTGSGPPSWPTLIWLNFGNDKTEMCQSTNLLLVILRSSLSYF